jgi:prevent-host-death family protein
MAMRQVGVAELKNNLSRHLRAVEAGETLEVTDHDRPIARLTPVLRTSGLVIQEPTRPFSEIAGKRYPPANLPVSSLELLLTDRGKR